MRGRVVWRANVEVGLGGLDVFDPSAAASRLASGRPSSKLHPAMFPLLNLNTTPNPYKEQS